MDVFQLLHEFFLVADIPVVIALLPHWYVEIASAIAFTPTLRRADRKRLSIFLHTVQFAGPCASAFCLCRPSS